MILPYIKKKENIEKKISDQIYLKIIKEIKKIFKKYKQLLISDFNVSFELLTILLFIIFFSNKGKNNTIKDEIMKNFINDLDISFRNEGIGDMSVGKYVKKYVKKFYFRIKKLDQIFKTNDKELFFTYIDDLKIISNVKKNEEFSIYLYNFIKTNISLLKSKNIAEFSFDNY
tara:strand:- start:74 stop:589 length:516 start_codon:yes stop_codon:yes gene_type:complete